MGRLDDQGDPAIEVDVLPFEGHRLPAPAPGVSHEVERGFVGSVLGLVEDLRDRLYVGDLHLVPAWLRWVYGLTDVPMYHALPHGVLECLGQHHVDVVDRVGRQAGPQERRLHALHVAWLSLASLRAPTAGMM